MPRSTHHTWDAPATYVIHVGARIDPAWDDWFDGVSITDAGDGTTVFAGTMLDQAMIFGLLIRLRDLGLPLLSVQRQGREAETEPPSAPLP